MNNETDNSKPVTSSGGDDTVAKLLNLAGPRADISEAVESRVHAAVLRDWQRATNRRTAMRWAIPASIAALLLVALTYNIRAPDPHFQPIGVVAQVVGTDANSPLVVGNPVYAGDRLATGPGHGITVSLFDDVSLRIAPGTSLEFIAADEITLLNGQLYADTGERIYRDRYLTVHTPNGIARDIGTQFLVAYDDARLRVAVREGRVDVVSGKSSFTTVAGEALTLRSGQDAVVDDVSPYDESWQWATSLAPGFEIENQTLLDFLKWASRETGKTLYFASDDLRMAAMKTELFGSIRDFTPAEAIDAVLATTEFRYRVDEISIRIGD